MAKMLKQGDFNLTNIGTVHELDEVTPVFEMEHRKDDNGEIITDRDGNPRNFATDKVIGFNCSTTILDGEFKKKSTQIKILNAELPITNEEIMALDSVKVQFENLQVSMVGNPMYYRADSITIIEPKKK